MSSATRRARAQAVSGRRAGLVSRLLVAAIDLLACVGILFGILVAVGVVRYLLGAGTFHLPKAGTLFTAAALPLVELVYLTAAWTTTGRSVGKQLVGLRVVTNAGEPLTLWRALPRAAICVTVGGISLLWAGVSSRNAALHDLALRTAVVHDWGIATRTPPTAVVVVVSEEVSEAQSSSA